MTPIEIMHKFFGSGNPSDKCKDCKNLVGHTWYKCRIYGETSSAASDWRKKWNSCAMFNMPYDGVPIIKVKGLKKGSVNEQIEGQMTIFDYEKGDA